MPGIPRHAWDIPNVLFQTVILRKWCTSSASCRELLCLVSANSTLNSQDYLNISGTSGRGAGVFRPIVTSRHYNDVILTTIASQITSLTVVYSIVYSGADQRKHQSSASLAFVRGIHRDRWIPCTKGQWRGHSDDVYILSLEGARSVVTVFRCSLFRLPADAPAKFQRDTSI